MSAAVVRSTMPLLLLGAALLGYRMAYHATRSETPVEQRTEPRVIAPRYDLPSAVTDEQLVQVLERVRPPRVMPLTNNLVHALRLWGPHADFGDEKIPSGREMLDYLLDDAGFQRLAGKTTPPLWMRRADGVYPRNFEDDAASAATASYHVDDLLATLAESGVPLTQTVKLREGEATVSELLDTSMNSFFLKRHEYEWSLIAYVRYAHPRAEWRNEFGERLPARELLEHLTRGPLELGPCNGLHRLEALVLLARAEEEEPSLSPSETQKLHAHLHAVSQTLVAAQAADGTWSRSWPLGAKSLEDKKPVPLSDKILVTGHHLEWLALAPPEALPPRETIVRAAQWLARTLPELDDREIEKHYGPYSHAARALCLWRSKDPFAVWQESRSQSTANRGE